MIHPIQHHILENEITYTGEELRPHWGLEQTGIYGSLMVAFIGPCKVRTQDLVDWEDKLQNEFIEAQSMLHIIGEFFDVPLNQGVLLQRFFIVWAEQHLRESGIEKIKRQGNDIFIRNKKLSVSIATVSPVSSLMHCGFNLDATGAPVDAIGLYELGFNRDQALSFSKKLLTSYIKELEDMKKAQCKVKPL